MNLDAFLAKINVSDDKSCWEWTGGCNNSGYGNVRWWGKHYTAHRIMAWYIGLVDSPAAPKDRKGGGFVLHSCDNPKCCNPGHFNIGSYSKNQAEAYERGRKQQPRGHKHVNAKLTNEQAIAIRLRYVKGATQTTLAKEYSVSQRVISLITRRKTYL